ncbi:hypothetical protein, conserved [Trypanosoma brucei brucei TREU927]|uniref:JmjC domain-containing protein n=1 Tax=Trypanosoma brucei brucei (strain 927/4 GUTat10.1) TaxID=185431 RepID=Q386V9_TRYB2|nr:hypothetical protein, conserved [Trypanosoma brucei brucei TREU927]EAN79172.1 hypothetical protein, conserved [Trypanosoma brucei brucei TREU927]
MAQSWFKRHPLGIYPRGNAKNLDELVSPRFGILSTLQFASKGRAGKCCILGSQPAEEAFVDVMLHLLSFVAVDDMCRLSAVCTGWYCFIHASDAFKQAHGLLSPTYTCFEGSWKETAIRRFIKLRSKQRLNTAKRMRLEGGTPGVGETVNLSHRPVMVKRAFYNDQLFQAWMCTILPCHYHLRQSSIAGTATANRQPSVLSARGRYRSPLKEVPRCSGLSVDEFRTRFEETNLPVIIADVATEWPIYKILQEKFENLAVMQKKLFRPGTRPDVPMCCEHTTMSVADYVRYARDQTDERPIYLFDSEFGTFMDVESLYTVPEYFSRDDFFKVLGGARPKYRWIIAGPRRGGSSFHVDPNYTSAWNANLTGLKRWILLPPGHTPAGVFPSEDMSEVVTPVSLTEWLLNHYDATVEKWRDVAYECVCGPGDIMFIPCGWWHFVINLEDSVAITQNYVSKCNLSSVLKFLSVMKSSISGIDEDVDNCDTSRMVETRRANFAEEFAAAMHLSYPELMQTVAGEAKREAEERHEKKKMRAALPLLDVGSNGFAFSF